MLFFCLKSVNLGTIFEILTISEDAFEIHSGLGVGNRLLKQFIQRGVKQSCDPFQQFCDQRKQALDEGDFQQFIPNVAKEISKGFVIG